MIASAQITYTEIFAFIVALVLFKKEKTTETVKK